jgi:short-subunit dehydrogenase
MTERPRAIVTGASSGIGLEIACQLAEQGYDLVVVARNKAALQSLAERINAQHSVEVLVYACDLSHDAERSAFVDQTLASGLRVDVVINNAGFGSTGSFAELDLEGELKQIDLNVKAAVALTHASLKPMLERGSGHILNVASTAAFQPGPFMAVYFATKAFLDSFTQAVAWEVRDSGVKVISFCPGPTESGFGAVSGNDKNHLFKKPGADAKDVAKAAIDALKSGKPLKVVGFQNWLGSKTPGFVPGWIVKRITAHLNSPVGE